MKNGKWFLVVALLVVAMAVSLVIAYRDSMGPSEMPEGVVQIGPKAGGVFEDREMVWISSVTPEHIAGMSWYALSGYRIEGNQVIVEVNEPSRWDDPSPYDFIYRLEYKPSVDTVYVYQGSYQKDISERLVAAAEECSATYYGNCGVSVYNSKGEMTSLGFGMFGDEIHFSSMVPYAYIEQGKYKETFPLYTGLREVPANIKLGDGDEIWFDRVEGDSRYSLLVAYRSEKPFTVNEERAEIRPSLGEYYLGRIWTEETTGVDKIAAESEVRFSYSTGGGFDILMKVGVNVPRGTP